MEKQPTPSDFTYFSPGQPGEFFPGIQKRYLHRKIDTILSEAFPGECITSSKSRINKLSLFLTSPLNNKIGQGDPLDLISRESPTNHLTSAISPAMTAAGRLLIFFWIKFWNQKPPRNLC
jgi:hypothetical protein